MVDGVPGEALDTWGDVGYEDEDLAGDDGEDADCAEEVEAEEAGFGGVVVDHDCVEGATVADEAGGEDDWGGVSMLKSRGGKTEVVKSLTSVIDIDHGPEKRRDQR